MGTPALLLDRDGVVNVEKNYLHRAEDFEFIPGIFETCLYFRDKGYALVVVTNQAGIARGLYSEADYARLTRWMRARFRDQGIELDGVYHCPHHPDHGPRCQCRKPAPGLLLRAARELDLCLSRSIMVGDKESDVAAGRAAGAGLCLLVRSGHAVETPEDSGANAILDSIADLPSYVATARADLAVRDP